MSERNHHVVRMQHNGCKCEDCTTYRLTGQLPEEHGYDEHDFAERSVFAGNTECEFCHEVVPAREEFRRAHIDGFVFWICVSCCNKEFPDIRLDRGDFSIPFID